VTTISEVKNAYYSLLLARDSYEALEANYKTSEMNAQTVTAKYNQGTVSEYDKLVADVQLASIKPQLLSSANGIKLAEMQLKVLMGVDVNEPICFEGKLSDYEEQLFADLMTLKSDTSLTDNSSLRQLDIQARQLKLAEKINKLGYIPTLALSLTAGYQAYAEEFNPFDAQYFGNTTLALSLSWTIFDGGAKYMKTKQNKLSITNLETQRENLVRQLELSVNNSLNSIETSAEQVVSNKENVYSAERAYSISQKRYDIGSGTLLEMTSSESTLLSARLQYVQSIYEFLSARATLEATLGKLVTDK
jgi:outer membrane protein TolC